ncbi:hypothetical protein HPP92_017307 [Vanilla planifolia]|uniref:CBS domain-containing protein n=1 Tax=Vanilla planifolia TaxID=51239 RepID=A0A835ULU0_VANPL|nr:hypothetical protein HPP92_017307 [Vanilla planifolia]
MTGAEFDCEDENALLRSVPLGSASDLEAQSPSTPPSSSSPSSRKKGKGIGDILRHLDRGLSGRRLNRRHSGRGISPCTPDSERLHDELGDGAPPEWALLLIGCLLGVATGICVAAFNRGVHVIHEWAWAGTPNEGASWLRLQRLADTWHRILLIPVTGGVVVGMMHGLLEIFEQIKLSRSQKPSIDLLAGIFPTIKAIQAAVTLGTEMMENNRERRIALVAAGAAAGIASGFNAAVAGCFFAIETVLRPLRAENSPPFTTAMIILASVISSTVSNVLLGERPAFTVPTYELKSAAGGLGAGIIALKYPGTLYWGFTNVDEILHTGKSAAAPGIGLLTQLAAAKVVSTALCKGSGLVGGLYAPSLMIGAAIGAVFGGSAAELINSAIPGNSALAQPQAYALVGMAATLASVCSVPLTSVLLLFELTKDYRILLPLMGAVGLAIWIPSVANQSKDCDVTETSTNGRGYYSLSLTEDTNGTVWRDGDDLELSILDTDVLSLGTYEALLDDLKVSEVMSKNFVKVLPTAVLKEVTALMHDKKQNCALVVDNENFLEGILTRGDLQRRGYKASIENHHIPKDSTACDMDACPISSCFTRGFRYRGGERGILTCFPDTDLTMAKELMEAKGIKQLPVVKRCREGRKQGKRRLVGLLKYDSIERRLREEMQHRKSHYQQRKERQENGH